MGKWGNGEMGKWGNYNYSLNQITALLPEIFY